MEKFFITMIRLGEQGLTKGKSQNLEDLITPKRMVYLSYDHSEIIVLTKADRYSDGIKGVKELREIFRAVKTYTVFGVRQAILEFYKTIQKNVEDEIVCCRLHCMVKNYDKAENFIKLIEERVKERSEAPEKIEIHKFEAFGGYDWQLELDEISFCSILALYRTADLLTHANAMYNEAFFNIESEILVWEG